MRRDAPAETKPKDSSESSEESLDKIAADLGKVLGAQENEELKKIVDSVNTAKTDEQVIDAYVRNIWSTIIDFLLSFEIQNNNRYFLILILDENVWIWSKNTRRT